MAEEMVERWTYADHLPTGTQLSRLVDQIQSMKDEYEGVSFHCRMKVGLHEIRIPVVTLLVFGESLEDRQAVEEKIDSEWFHGFHDDYKNMGLSHEVTELPLHVVTECKLDTVSGDGWSTFTGLVESSDVPTLVKTFEKVLSERMGMAQISFHGSLVTATINFSQDTTREHDGNHLDISKELLLIGEKLEKETEEAEEKDEGDQCTHIEGISDNRVWTKEKKGYEKARECYATSSYVGLDRMYPNIIVQVRNSEEVIAACNYAKEHGLKVVGRSGGHQYCGMSSGGDDTLLLDLSLLSFVRDGEKKNTVVIGTGSSLKKISRSLLARKMFLPHGECPEVAVGGHVQTGGFGHLQRTFGLCVDYVIEFEMVCWNSDEEKFECRIFKPDDEWFPIVLGGGPGSWGIIISYTFLPGLDKNYKNSYAYCGLFPYPSKYCFRQMMREWVEFIRDTKNDANDNFVTLIDGSFHLGNSTAFRPPLAILEALSKNKKGRKYLKRLKSRVHYSYFYGKFAKLFIWLNPLEQLMDAALDGVFNTIQNHPSIAGGSTPEALYALNHLNFFVKANQVLKAPLSKTADVGVRQENILVMPHSREFAYPYVKSLYASKKPLPDDFVEPFVDLCFRVLHDKKVKLVFQGAVGGGKILNNKKLPNRGNNRQQHRDFMVNGIVFDVFYVKEEYKETAVNYSKEMRQLWKDTFGDSEENRNFWGSWESNDVLNSDGELVDELNMSLPEVQAMYYNSPEEFKFLQKMKDKIDPLNIFGTKFTVPPSVEEP